MFLYISMQQTCRYLHFVPFQYGILICLIKIRASLKDCCLPVELFQSTILSFLNQTLCVVGICRVSFFSPTPHLYTDKYGVFLFARLVSIIFSKAPKQEFLLRLSLLTRSMQPKIQRIYLQRFSCHHRTPKLIYKGSDISTIFFMASSKEKHMQPRGRVFFNSFKFSICLL